MHPAEFRLAVRRGEFYGTTAGHCGDYAQANLVILPRAYADDFTKFCMQNPKTCPLLGVANAGAWNMPELGDDLDIRTDVPGYYIYRDGELSEEKRNLLEVWRDDFVTFAIGCSFSFEYMLQRAEIRLRHIEQKKNVAMYVTNIPNERAGKFAGNMVVSMRPMSADSVIKAVQITARYPAIHGAPVHFGDPSVIGIRDLQHPDFGDPVDVLDQEVPVFWGCGVTPQEALRAARLPLAITHKPGHMLITDILNARLAV
jgi:uncharacterized protein YcsI (UPF0317 family)